MLIRNYNFKSHISSTVVSFLFPITIVILIKTEQIQSTFPDHNATEDKMINPVLDPRDNPACGLFRSDQGRVFHGTESYEGQFPWTVCLMGAVGEYVKKLATGKMILMFGMVADNIYDFGPNSDASKQSGIEERVT